MTAKVFLFALIAVHGGIFCGTARATETETNQPIPAAPAKFDPSEIEKWNGSLRQAGATATELDSFEQWVRRLTADNNTPTLDFFRHATADDFLNYLISVREAATTWVTTPLLPGIKPIRPAEALRALDVPGITLESISVDTSQTDSTRITATITHPPARDHVVIWMILPTKNWNGRFLGHGGGGFLGGDAATLDDAVSHGFASGATDTGHAGDTGSFALDANGRLDWQRIRDWSYLGIHEMTLVGKALAGAYYGQAPRYAYFIGASAGGRQGLVEAQRYPDDYNGIISACPAVNLTRALPALLWPQVVMNGAKPRPSRGKLDAATAAAIAATDSLDGIMDGVLQNPAACTFDPRNLVGTGIGSDKFTDSDAAVVRKLWAGPRDHNGEYLWPGVMPGADLSARIVASGTSLDYARYFLLRNPHWDPATFSAADFELLWNQSVEEFGEVLRDDDADLARFRDHGGKLIINQGLADPFLNQQGIVDYYQRVVQNMGGPQKTADFARLFLFPGLDHGFQGAGPRPLGGAHDNLALLVSWVEQGRAPERIATLLRNKAGQVVRTRPVFAYPAIAKYRGEGSTDDEATLVSSLESDKR